MFVPAIWQNPLCRCCLRKNTIPSIFHVKPLLLSMKPALAKCKVLTFKSILCHLGSTFLFLTHFSVSSAKVQQLSLVAIFLPAFEEHARRDSAKDNKQRSTCSWFGWWQHWSPSQQHMDTGHGWENTNATLRRPCASPWHTESMGNLEQEGRHAHNTTWHECRGQGDRETQHTHTGSTPELGAPFFVNSLMKCGAIIWFNLEFILETQIRLFASLQFVLYSALCDEGFHLHWHVRIFSGWPSGFLARSFCHLLGKHSSVQLNQKLFPQLQFVLQSEWSVRRPYVGLGSAGVIDFDRLLICWYQSGNDVSVYL